MDRKADPGGRSYLCEIDLAGKGGADIRSDNAQQNGNDLDHALAPDIADHDDDDRDQGHPPAGLNVIES